MAGFGLVIGYTAILVTQLKQPESSISVDASSASWLAAIIGISLVPSNFVAPVISGKYGRKIASLVSILPSITGWLIIFTATNITSLLAARFLHGFSLGIVANIGPILIGEYTSPKHRGMFLSMISVAFCVGTLLSHTLGSFLSWQRTALVFSLLSCVNFVIVIFSPESPSWLVSQGRYEESRKVFNWLRGEEDDEELKEIIAADFRLRKASNKNEVQSKTDAFADRINYYKITVKKKEFYKPLILVIHLYIMAHWGGTNIFSAYIVDLVNTIVGKNSKLSLIIISISVQRLITTLIATYVVKKVKRKKLLILGGVLNISVLIIEAVYSHLKCNNLLPFDHEAIGIFLLHLHILKIIIMLFILIIFSIAMGTLTVPIIIVGELFPLEFRSISSAICVLSLTPNMITVLKTFPFIFDSVGLLGAFSLYALVITYCLIILCIFLPETKDRTLQDIENEFRGFGRDDEKVRVPLTENDC